MAPTNEKIVSHRGKGRKEEKALSIISSLLSFI